jgi:TolA-binding protein
MNGQSHMIITWEAVTAVIALFSVATAGMGFFVRSTVRWEVDKLRLEIGQIMAGQTNQTTRIEVLQTQISQLQGWIEETDRRLRDMEQCCIAQHAQRGAHLS